MLKTNGRNMVSKDEIIFQEGDALTQIGIVFIWKGDYAGREYPSCEIAGKLSGA